MNKLNKKQIRRLDPSTLNVNYTPESATLPLHYEIYERMGC